MYEHFCLLLLTRKRSVSSIRNILIIPPFCKGGLEGILKHTTKSKNPPQSPFNKGGGVNP